MVQLTNHGTNGRAFQAATSGNTRHAQERMQQRAIPMLVVDLIRSNGSCMRHNGADIFFIDKEARRRLRRELGGDRSVRLLEPWLGHYLVIGDDGGLITAAPRFGRLKRP